MLDAEIAVDGMMGGARNVFLRVGLGRLHLYDQPPRGAGQGAIHHLGIRIDDLRALVARMRERGAEFRSGIREFGAWRYIMVAAPDDVLLELFEVEAERMEPPFADYFAC